MVTIRKYAGPLQPGKRSAYVPGTRKNTSYRSLPGRLRGGRSSYKKSKAKSKSMASYGEVKLQPLSNIDNEAPIRMNPLVAGIAPVYGVRYVIGDALAAYTNYSPLGGMSWSQGTADNQRVGNYLYMKKIHMTLQVNMNQVGQTNVGPRKFRLIVFKARRSVDPTGTTYIPNTQLMLNSAGDAFGVSSTAAPVPTMLDFTSQITNKRNFQIYKDSTFILQNPLGDPSASIDPLISSSGQYKSQKTMKLSLPLWKKTRFERTNSNLPTDLNYNYGIYLQALNVGSSTAQPDDWTVSVRGTVSANDN